MSVDETSGGDCMWRTVDIFWICFSNASICSLWCEMSVVMKVLVQSSMPVSHASWSCADNWIQGCVVIFRSTGVVWLLRWCWRMLMWWRWLDLD